jgi:ubiquitin C-terminal hydrolase
MEMRLKDAANENVRLSCQAARMTAITLFTFTILSVSMERSIDIQP